MGLRITDQGLTNSRTAWIADGRSTVARAEQQVSTGRKIENPSEDPGAAAQLMRYDMRLQRLTQYQRNAGNAKLWVGAADTALQSTATNLTRAKTIAVQAGNDTLGLEENAALASDIRAIADEIQTLANTKVSGRAIFAGTAGTANAYDGNGAYLGNTEPVQFSVDTNQLVTVGGIGPLVFGNPNPGDPMNGSVLEALEALATAIETDDNLQVRAGIEAMNVAMNRVGAAEGQVGSTAQALDAIDLRHSGERLAVEENVSSIRDTDMAEAIIRLRSAEAGYEATLSATARGISRSLLDFLR
jgi:flagellar hook-associated protein 3 FlgL